MTNITPDIAVAAIVNHLNLGGNVNPATWTVTGCTREGIRRLCHEFDVDDNSLATPEFAWVSLDVFGEVWRFDTRTMAELVTA